MIGSQKSNEIPKNPIIPRIHDRITPGIHYRSSRYWKVCCNTSNPLIICHWFNHPNARTDHPVRQGSDDILRFPSIQISGGLWLVTFLKVDGWTLLKKHQHPCQSKPNSFVVSRITKSVSSLVSYLDSETIRISASGTVIQILENPENPWNLVYPSIRQEPISHQSMIGLLPGSIIDYRDIENCVETHPTRW